MSYTKYHDPWASLHELTGKALNHLESQWDCIKSDADAHDHDTRYYPKATADATFFSTTFHAGFDCDLLDGQHLSNILAAVMPIGAIMIWSGTDATVPAGWHICDGGTYGGITSPDLRDRFVIGAGGSYSVGATVGPATWNGTITPTGSVTVGSHALTTSEIPVHGHGFTEYLSTICGWMGIYEDPLFTGVSSTTASIGAQSTGDQVHTHTGSSISIAAIDPRPPYHSLYYVIKYS